MRFMCLTCPFTSKRLSAALRSNGFTPPSPSVGTTMSCVPPSTSAIFSPTMFSLPAPRSAAFSSSIPLALASFTTSSPSAALVRR